MCGIAGIWVESRHRRDYGRLVDAMADAIRHRGPDSSGSWIDPESGIGLGHRRLAVLDLSPHGHQPMQSCSGRYVISFNGEVYNYRRLRAELGQHVQFRGSSDTEVMLAAIEAYGLTAAVRRFVGMFAFALWDRDRRRLHLVRDRIGIKPLYYGRIGNTFAFASELKAFRTLPGFKAQIDRNALALLLRNSCVPAPYSIYQGIRKLPAGTILTIDTPNDPWVQPVSYWSARDKAEHGLSDRFAGSDEAAADELEKLLCDAVGLRMVADVPLGAFLSGGIDSSLVVALMQQQSSRPVRTYSIGSPDRTYDEAAHARRVATHLGTCHTELYVTPDDALGIIPKLPALYDEPFSDSSQIPTFLVSELARRDVTVSLSGDGGDELFGGYNRHVWGRRVWNAVRLLPTQLRQTIADRVAASDPDQWNCLYLSIERAIPALFRQRMFGYKVNKLAGAFAATDANDLYDRLSSHWLDASSVVLGGSESDHPFAREGLSGTRDYRTQMMFFDLLTYLPDDILTKLDRASMAVGLEARVPLLDHRVVEFAWRLPMSMKIRNGQGKWLLRQVLYRHVPKALVNRPKSGFGVPLGAWLRGPLRDWTEALLDERRLTTEGFFKAEPIRELWAQHLSGRASWQYHLWDILMFQAWLEVQRVDVRPIPSNDFATAMLA